MKTPARLFAFLLLSGASLYADVPATINYQGIVSDSTGTLIGATGALNRKIIFRIYDASTGGNRLWTEEQTVTIYKGEFSVLLGNGTTATGTASSESHPTLDTIFTLAASTRYIEVMVDNGDGSITATDTPISPRQAITSAAYAFHAKVADGIASATDLTITPTSGTASNYGLGWYGSGRPWNGVSVDGPVLYGNAGGALGSNNGSTKNISLLWNASGQVGIGVVGSFGSTNKLTLQGDDASTPASQLSIRGNVDTNERLQIGFDTTNNRSTLQSYAAASTTAPLLLNPSGGLVGIGTSSPSASLTVEGSISATGSGGHGFGTGGDTDGGLFSPADGVVTLKTNGNERLRVDANGLVGIGTTTPSSWSKLNVYGGNLLIQSTSNPALGLRANDTTADYALVSTAGNYSTSALVGDLVIAANSGKLHLKSFLADSALTIGTDNKVGIGTANPAFTLDVNGSLRAAGDMTLGSHVYMNNSGVIFGKNSSGVSESCLTPRYSDNNTYLDYGSGGFYLRNSTSAVAMRVDSNGYVGIGTSSPVVPLDVANYNTINMADNGYSSGSATTVGTTITLNLPYQSSGRGIEIYSQDGVGAFPNNYTVQTKVGIRSQWAIATASVFLAYSDRRIKCDLHTSSPTNDLALIEKLQATNYRMVDPEAGTEWKKGFIAQEVEKVIPQAVSRSTEFVPDIMAVASISHFDAADKTLALMLSKDHALKVGDKVRLHVDGRRLDLPVSAVPNAHEFVVQGCDKAPEKVLVYGKEVNDFRTVDYNRLYTTGLGAIQELSMRSEAQAKELAAKDVKISALEAKLAEQEKRATAQAEQGNSQNARLVAIEKLLSKGGSETQTVSLKAGE